MVCRIYLGLAVVFVPLVVDVIYTTWGRRGAGSLTVPCSAAPVMQDHMELISLPVFAVLQSRCKSSDGCVLGHNWSGSTQLNSAWLENLSLCSPVSGKIIS